MVAVIILKFDQVDFTVCHLLEMADKLAKSVYRDQAAPLEQPDLGLHCLLNETGCFSILGYYDVMVSTRN